MRILLIEELKIWVKIKMSTTESVWASIVVFLILTEPLRYPFIIILPCAILAHESGSVSWLNILMHLFDSMSHILIISSEVLLNIF